VIISVLGTKVPRSTGCIGSAQAQHGRNPFSGSKSSEREKYRWQHPRSIYKTDRRSSGFQSYRVAQGLALEGAPIVQIRLGFSNKIGTGGSLSAYRGSTFRKSRSHPFITLEIADQRNVESAFGAEPTVLAPGLIKRACEGGTTPFVIAKLPRPFISRTRGTHPCHVERLRV
jgi:hypothetical protein